MSSNFQVFEQISHDGNRSGSDQLRDFIINSQIKLFDEGEAARASIQNLDDFKKYNEEMYAKFIEGLGGLPDMDCPLDPKITKRTDYGTYVAEQILFCARPNAYVSGTMYLPKGIKTPSPAVLYLSGHLPSARLADEYQVVSRVFVEAGFVVFAMDPIGQGERANFYDPETGTYPIGREVADHDACGVPALATKINLASYFVSDLLRAVDYMLTRPEIDGSKIGLTGCSGGGTQTLLSMICDKRIAAAAPVAFLTRRREYMYHGMSQDMEQIWPGITGFGFDHANAIMMMTPRPVAVMALSYDFFPIEGTLASIDEAKPYYEMADAKNNLRMYLDKTTHGYSLKHACDAVEFFSEYFFGETRTVDVSTIRAVPEAEMYATTGGNIISDVPGAVSVLNEVQALAKKHKIERFKLDEAERKARAKAWLSEKVFAFRSPVPFNPRIHNSSSSYHWIPCDGYIANGISWWTQKQLFSYATMIRKAGNENNDNLPTVIAVWTDGTKEIASHEEWIRKTCDEGKQVLVLDAPGVGKLEQNSLYCHTAYKGGCHCTLYHLCCDLLFMGDCMAAMHTYDVLRAIEMACEVFEIQEEDITLYCDGDDGVYGIMAGFLNEKVNMEYGKTLLTNIQEHVVDQKILKYNNTLSLIVTGMLEYFDYDELMR